MSTGKDSRRDPRAKVLSMTVRYKSATVAEFKENHSYDVSRGGLFIKTSSPFPPGTLLKFEVRIAEEQKVMMGVGRVTWKREEAQGPEKPAGMGVKFIKLDDESTKLIDELVTTREDAEAGFEEGARDSGIAISSPPPAREVQRSSFSDPDKSVIAHTADILRSALGATGPSKAPSLPPDDEDRRTVPNAAPTSVGAAKSESAAGAASTSGAPRSLPPRPTQSKPPTSTTVPVKAENEQATEAKTSGTPAAPEPRTDAAKPESDSTSSSKTQTTAVSASASEKETESDEKTESKEKTEDEKPPSQASSSKRPAAAKKPKRSKRETAKKSSSRPPAGKNENKPKATKSSSSTLTTTPPKRAQAQEEEKESEKTSPLLWIMLGAIALVVGYYLFTQNESSKVPEPEPEPKAEPEQVPAEATQPPLDELPTEGTTNDPPIEPSAAEPSATAAEPSTTAAAEITEGAAEEAAQEDKPKTPVARPRPAPRPKRPPPPPPTAAPTPAPIVPEPVAPVAPSPTSAPPPAETSGAPPRAPTTPTSPTPPAAPKAPDTPTPGPEPSAD